MSGSLRIIHGLNVNLLVALLGPHAPLSMPSSLALFQGAPGTTTITQPDRYQTRLLYFSRLHLNSASLSPEQILP